MHITLFCNFHYVGMTVDYVKFMSQVGGEDDVELRGFVNNTSYGIVYSEVGIEVVGKVSTLCWHGMLPMVGQGYLNIWEYAINHLSWVGFEA